MGLDMYLSAERYFWSGLKEEGDTVKQDIGQLMGVTMPVKKVSLEAGYWRKANQIHRWFVTNVQEGEDDCGDYAVSRDDLKNLRELCVKAMDSPEDAPNLLPTAEGFFFGGSEYDQWYFSDLADTIKIIDECLTLPEDWDFSYHSSW